MKTRFGIGWKLRKATCNDWHNFRQIENYYVLNLLQQHFVRWRHFAKLKSSFYSLSLILSHLFKIFEVFTLTNLPLLNRFRWITNIFNINPGSIMFIKFFPVVSNWFQAFVLQHRKRIGFCCSKVVSRAWWWRKMWDLLLFFVISLKTIGKQIDVSHSALTVFRFSIDYFLISVPWKRNFKGFCSLSSI